MEEITVKEFIYFLGYLGSSAGYACLLSDGADTDACDEVNDIAYIIKKIKEYSGHCKEFIKNKPLNSK